MLEEFKTYQNGDVQIILKRLFKKKCLFEEKQVCTLFIFYFLHRV